MKVGCVKEIKNNEFRVGMTPDNVKSYVAAAMRFTLRRARAQDPVSRTLSTRLPVRR